MTTAPHDPDVDALLEAACRSGRAGSARLEALAARLRHRERAVGVLLDDRLVPEVEALWARGWNPAALVHAAQRRLDRQHGHLAASLAVGDVHRQRARDQPVDPRWQAELDALGPRAAQAPTALAELLAIGAGLWCLLTRLPTVPQTTPPPGAVAATTGAAPRLDDRTLARVRALLAKAESTPYDEEAEALSAKAQELIARHAIDHALLDGEAGDPGAPALRRHLVDDPYADAKTHLVSAVAAANRCEAVVTAAFGWVTLAGDERDLDAVELLATSLLTQAASAMHRQGSRRDAAGRSRTRSFRRSFLFGFAQRIGERLREAEHAEVAAAAAGDDRVLPVLAAREERAREAIEAAFPHLVRRSVTVSHAGGWSAGRAAADLADLDAGAQRLPQR